MDGYWLADLVFEEIANVLGLRGDLLAFKSHVGGFRLYVNSLGGGADAGTKASTDSISAECFLPAIDDPS